MFLKRNTNTALKYRHCYKIIILKRHYITIYARAITKGKNDKLNPGSQLKVRRTDRQCENSTPPLLAGVNKKKVS